MSISYQYNEPGGYVLAKVSNNASLEQVQEYIESLISDISINKPFYEIVDFSDVSAFDFGYFQSDELLELFVKLKKEKSYLGSLLIANMDLSKGMSNIFRVIGEDKGIIVKVFSTLDDALKYITDENI